MRQTFTLKFLLSAFLLLLGLTTTFAQVEMKLQLLPNDTSRWGVFVKHNGSIQSPSNNVDVGSAQATIVAPTGFVFANMTNVNGIWSQNARVNAPSENPNYDYISIGYLSSFPNDGLSDTTETLLFTFEKVGPCPDTLYLIDNNTDPFNVLPNSANNNPGNNFDVIDKGYLPILYLYAWSRNYALSGWSCNDCDGDGLLDAQEDTNGDGNWDPISEDLNGNGSWDTALDEDLNGDGNWDEFSEDMNGNGVLDLVINEDLNGDGNFDPISEDLNGNGLYDSCIDEDYNGNGILDAGEDLNGNGVLDASLDEDLDGDGNFSLLAEDLDRDGVYDAAMSEDRDGDGNFDTIPEDLNGNGLYDVALNEDLDGDGNFSLEADASEACNACDPIHPLAAEMRGDTVMCASEDNVDIFVDIVDGWSPYTVVYKDKDCNYTTLNNYESGDPINITLTATDTFRVVSVVDSRGCPVDTVRGQAIVAIEGPLAITANPTDVIECVENPTAFYAPSSNGSINADTSIIYSWQVRTSATAAGYSNVVNGTPYAGADTDSLQISDIDGLNLYQFRLAISTEHCDTVFSAWATLNVEGPIMVDLETRDTSVCNDETAEFYSEASAPLGTVSGSWEYSTDGGTTWLPASGADFVGTTTGTLTVSNVRTYSDNLFRRAYTTPTCSVVNSTEGLLTVEGPIVLTDEPDDILDCSAQALEFIVGVENQSLSANAGTVSYQWQVSTDNEVTWTNLMNDMTYNGASTDTLSVDVSNTVNGNYYRVIFWSGECSRDTSRHAFIEISDGAEFTSEPQDIDICDGDNHTFTSSATVAQGNFDFAWQVSTDGGTTWNDVADGASTGGVVYSGAATSDLTLTGISYLQNQFLYRVEARTHSCGAVASIEALLSVEGPLSIDSQPVNDTICRNDQAIFETVVINPGAGNVAYQWQLKSALGGGWIDLVDNSVYNGVNTPRLSLNTDQGGNDGDSLKVIVSTPTCVSIASVCVRMVIEGPLEFTDMPNDTTVCSGNPAEFFALAESENDGVLEYLWEISEDTVNYSEMANGGVYSGVDTRHLQISDVTGLYDNRYRLKVRTGECDWVISEFAELTVEGPFDINPDGQPVDVTLCTEGNAQVFAGVTNDGSGDIMYQWEIKRASDPGAGWVDLVNDTTYNGTTTDTVSIAPLVEEMNGDSVRVRIWTGTCAVTISDGARLAIEGAVEITTEPAHDTICSGGVAQFDIAFTNGASGTPVWQWQVSTDAGATWADVSAADPVYSGINSTNLVITGADHTYNQNWYRVSYFFPTCGVQYSDDAILTVEGAISITNDPTDVIACDAEDVVFFISTQNLGGGTLEYQWQINRAEDAAGWVDISTAGTEAFNGYTTPVLQQGEIDATDNGDRFRVIIQTGECTSITSDEALLNVEGPLDFTNHPDDIIVCAGSDTIMVAAFTNPGNGAVDIQWEYSENGGITWQDALESDPIYTDVTNDTLIITDVAGLDQNWYRAKISTSTCPNEYSEPGIITVEGPLTPTDPLPITDCNNNSVIFTTQLNYMGAGTVNYQWEINRGMGWMDLTSNLDSFYNGVRSDTLSVSDINSDTLNGAEFRVRVWTSTCATVWTNPATLTIEGPIEFTDMPNDTTVCSGEPAFFEIAADNGTGGTVNYQWQVSTDGVIWTDLANAAPYSNVNSPRLDIADVAGLYGRRYRCGIWTNTCDIIYSDNARLTVEGPLTFDPLEGLTACRNEAYFFQVGVTNGGSGVMTYQWEVLDVSTNMWSDVNDDTWVHGTETTLLQLDSMDIMQTRGDTVFRLRVELPTCSPFYSDSALLHIVSDTLGFCDFDMDGEINDIDEDDDNDGLDDVWEYSCLNYGQFNVDVDMDGDDDGDEDWDGDGISNQEETDGDGVLDGNPCDPCDPLISSACFGIALDVKGLLYGPSFSGVATINEKMSTKLNDKGLIPTVEPYSDIKYVAQVNGQIDTIRPFVHAGPGGGETITDPTVLAVTGDDRIVDWVFVELRHANKIDSVVATRAALIQSDGDVVDVDGVSSVTFDTTVVAGEYYVALRHRNHLGVMTVDAPELSPDVRVVDFRDTAIVRHGNNPMFNTNFGNVKTKNNYLWAGDLRPDGRVIYQGPNTDVLQIFLKVLSDPNNDTGPQGGPNANHILEGYLLEDYNLDGVSIYQGPNNDRNMILLNTVLLHPGNENTLANFIVLEQLP